MVDRGSFSIVTNLNDLCHIHGQIRSRAHPHELASLGDSFQPNKWSVVCGRGRDCYDHVGNRRFRLMVDLHLQKYQASHTRGEKSAIVLEILETIREANRGCVGGGFVKLDPRTHQWYAIGDRLAREKIGQQFRIATTNDKKRSMQRQKKEQKKEQHFKLAHVKKQVSTEEIIEDSQREEVVQPFLIDFSKIAASRLKEKRGQRAKVKPKPKSKEPTGQG